MPTCKPCNAGVKANEEYLRVFLTALRGHTTGPAIEAVRARVMRQPDYQPGLRRHFVTNSELRPEADDDGAVTQALHTRPDSPRLKHVLSNYARGLHVWSTGTPAPPDALLSIERIFHMQTRPAEYWEPMLAARAFAAAGVITVRGTGGEFRFAFRELRAGDLLSAMVMEFWASFAYVALVCRPGTNPVRIALPF